MPDPQTTQFFDLSQEMENLRQQKKEILADYADSYKELDSKVMELTKVRDSLTEEVNGLQDQKDNAIKAVADAQAQADKIVANANASADEIVSEAQAKANKIKTDSDDVEGRVGIMINTANEMLSEATTKNDHAVELFLKASKANSDADALMQSAKDEEAMSISVSLKLEALKEQLEAKQESLSESLSDLDAKNTDYLQKLNNLNTEKDRVAQMADVLAAKTAEVDSLKDDIVRAKQEANVIIEAKKVELAKQATSNQNRSVELDIGFTKLKNDQDELVRQQKKLALNQAELAKAKEII